MNGPRLLPATAPVRVAGKLGWQSLAGFARQVKMERNDLLEEKMGKDFVGLAKEWIELLDSTMVY
jgi:hypothetical protein